MQDKKNKKNIRYIIYARKSSEDEGRQVRSIDDQIDECLKLVTMEKLSLIKTDEYPDGVIRESKSARIPNNRPSFERIIKELRRDRSKRSYDAIISWHPNRLSRNALESGQLIQMIDDEMLDDLRFCTYIFHNDPSGKEHLAFEFARAKGYSDHLSVDIIRGMKKRYKEGALMQQAPFGYNKKMEVPGKPDQSSLLPTPDQPNHDKMKRAFQMKLEGKTDELIANTLFTGVKGIKGGTIDGKRLSEFFKNPFYFGQKTWGCKEGDVFVDYTLIHRPDWEFEPVVSEEDFYAINRHLKSGEPKPIKPSVRNKHNIPLTKGKIICSHCGCNMSAGIPKQNIEYAQYRCAQKKCPNVISRDKTQNTIKIQPVFDAIEKDLEQYFKLTDKQFDMYVEHAKEYHYQERADLEQRIRSINGCRSSTEKEHEELSYDRTKAERRGAPDRQLAALDKKLIALDEEIQRYEDDLKDLSEDRKIYRTSFVEFLELGSDLHKRWYLANFKEKQRLAEIFLSNCIIKDNEIVDIVYAEPFQTTKEELLQGSSGGKVCNGGMRGNRYFQFRFSVQFKRKIKTTYVNGRRYGSETVYLEESQNPKYKVLS